MYIQILRPFKIFQSKTRSLGCRTFSFGLKMVTLQDLASRMVVMQDFCKSNGYLSRFLQDDGYLVISCKTFLKDDASSGQILQESCKILQDKHSILNEVHINFESDQLKHGV